MLEQGMEHKISLLDTVWAKLVAGKDHVLYLADTFTRKAYDIVTRMLSDCATVAADLLEEVPKLVDGDRIDGQAFYDLSCSGSAKAFRKSLQVVTAAQDSLDDATQRFAKIFGGRALPSAPKHQESAAAIEASWVKPKTLIGVMCCLAGVVSPAEAGRVCRRDSQGVV